MTNYEKYVQAFIEIFDVATDEVCDMQFKISPCWNSMDHVNLMVVIEEYFDIRIKPDDMLKFKSFEKGKEVLKNYNIII